MVSEVYSSAVVAFSLVECLIDHGKRFADIEQCTGIGRSELEGPDIHIPLGRLVRLWKMAEKATGDPALSIRLQQRYGQNRSHFINCLAMNSATGMEALHNWQRYCKLVCEANEVRLRQSANRVVIVYELTSAAHQNRWIPEHIFFQVVDYGRKFINRRLRIDEVRFRHPPPADPGAYENFFQAPVRFGQDEHALICQKEYIVKPSEQGNPHLAGALKGRAEADLRRWEKNASVCRRLEAVMVDLLATGSLDMERAAARMHMSRSTLHRRLKVEGATYLGLLTQTRKALAATYLKQGLTTNEMAYRLGYSNTANFLNAFRRWFGHSPRQIRQQRQP